MIPSEPPLVAFSERPLHHERLQTEYSFEDSQNSDTTIGSIAGQITVWKDSAYAFLCCFLLLFVHFAAGSPISTLIVPFIACDAKRVYYTMLAIQSVPSVNWTKTHVQSLAMVSCHLVFLLLLGAFLEWKSLPLLAAGAPHYVSLCIVMLCEHFRRSECQTFSKAVRPNQFRIFFMWIEAGTVIFVGLKVDGIVEMSWSSVLWPCWAAESLLCILTLGAGILFIYAFCSYLSKRCDGMTVLCSLWFLWVFAGLTVSFALCLYTAVKFSADFEVTVGMKASLGFPILFLMTGLLGLHLMETRITWWCFSFFMVEFDRQRSSQDALTNIAPQITRTLNTQTSVANTLLFRVSSTFFKPATVTPGKKSRPRTQITPISLSESPSNEEKITSVSMLQLDASPSAPRKMCMVCCQAFSNAVVMNCGHSGICSECAREIWTHTGICHMCREKIVKVLEVEIVDDSPFVKVVTETLEGESADNS